MPKIEGYSISEQQKRVWEFFQSEKAPFRSVSALKLVGLLQIDDLRKSLGHVIQRNQILRTHLIVPQTRSVPIQVVVEESEFIWQEVDWEGHSISLEAFLNEEENQSLQLDQGPILRATLAKAGPRQYWLILNLPASHCDYRGLSNLNREILETYDCLLTGGELAEESFQYAQFSEWLTELEGQSPEGKTFWHEHERQVALAVPRVKRGEIRPNRRLLVTPGPEFRQALQQLETRLETHSIRIVLAAWHVLLSRLNDGVTTPISVFFDGRTFEELEPALGLFSRYLPLVMPLPYEEPFESLFLRINQHLDDYFEMQHFYSMAGVEQNLRPLFAFDFQDQAPYLGAQNLKCTLLSRRHNQEYFAIKLSLLRPETDEFQLCFQYDGSRFSCDEVICYGERIQKLIMEIARDSSRPAARLPIMGENEARRLLVDFNDTSREFSLPKSVQTLFEASAAADPGGTALIFEEQRLSRDELNIKANRIAHRLRRHGVGPDDIVGLSFQRSPDFVIALLGVLKSGGAYLPLDAQMPRARLNKILEIAACKILLTDEKTRVGGIAENRTVCLMEEEPISPDDTTAANPAAIGGGDHLAYLIFTSGSTGLPKGVATTHNNLLNYLYGIEQRLELTEPNSFALMSSLAADLGNTALYPALCLGGALHLISAERITHGAALGAYLSREAVQAMKITPSHLAALMAQVGDDSVLPSNRLVLGGEATGSELLDQIRSRAPRLRIFNHYGPTETTVGVVTLAHTPAMDSLPMGQPMPNTQLYLLDSLLEPVLMYRTGEISIAGAGLTRGYIGSPHQTAANFVPNPFSRRPGSRIYKTGDLGRWRPDGNLEFIGRRDDQVKIRGFRVEPAEVNRGLQGHHQVKETHVGAWSNPFGEKELVSHVVPANPAADTAQLKETLTRYLANLLPDYMVPQHFIFLDELPLNANGKIDRKALPEPTVNRSGNIYQAPRNPMEADLISIWKKHLGIEKVGIFDNFFNLGGQSLKGAVIMARINEHFGIQLPLATIFEAFTPHALALRIYRTRLEKLDPDRLAYALSEMVPERKEPLGLDALDADLVTALALRFNGEGTTGETIPQLPRSGETQEFPLSFAQQRLWFLDQLEGSSTNYNRPTAMGLQGELCVQALEISLATIIKRHETFRTSFVEVDGRAVQRVTPYDHAQLHLPMVDFSCLPEERRHRLTLALTEKEARNPFDLSRGPLLRLSLFRSEKAEHLLLATMHHIITDGWSIGLLTNELSTLYTFFIDSLSRPTQANPLADLPIQYADFAVWQKHALNSDALEGQLAYWKRQLAGIPVMLELPTDRPRKAVQTFPGSSRTFALDEALSARLNHLARQSEISLFMLLHTVFSLLLSRYSGQRDIVVGTPVAGRNRREVEPLIGFFLNTLVIRADLNGNPAFTALLDRVRAVLLEAYANQDIPFEQVVEAVQPERNLSHSPLFQVLFIFQNTPAGNLHFPGLALANRDPHRGTTNFDITLVLGEGARGIAGSLEYNSDLFQAASMDRFAGHFLNLLKAAAFAADLDKEPVLELPLLDPTERTQLLVSWNETETPFPATRCVHELIEEQAARTPDALAFGYEDGWSPSAQLSYAELNRRADHLARLLIHGGIASEQVIALLAPRNLDYAVAMLAIWKSGGVYLPIDPFLPPRRIQNTLQLSQANLVLYTAEAAPLVNETLGEKREGNIRALELGEIPSAASPPSPAEPRTSPERLAYLIFTSGSTGLPKGVMVTQQGMVNHLFAKVHDLELVSNDVVSQNAPQSFDISIWQFWCAGPVGARTLIFHDDIARDPDRLIKRTSAGAITVLEIVPSLFGVMLDLIESHDEPVFFNHLRHLILTGEALPPEMCRRWLSAFPQIPMINAYGPTECSDDVTHFQIKQSPADERVTMPIGRPLINTQMYVLDSRLNPQPVQVPGALYVGGLGVGRGYFNDPGQTAGSFGPDPFGGQAGARLYATGDLGRTLPEGDIEFLGRMDFQVKIRGFRIELGEIETILSAHSEVNNAVVLTRDDLNQQGAIGDKFLVAYVLSDRHEEGDTSLAEILKTSAKKQLPEYMVPAAFVVLNAFPLTPNGKIDRKALPKPQGFSKEGRGDFTAPRNATEEILAAIWSDLLRRENIGVSANFFAVGGHSLIATQLVARIRQAFEVDLSLRSIFELPTIGQLGARVDELLRQNQGLQLPNIVPAASAERYPLSFGERGLFFQQQMDLNSSANNMSTGLRLKGPLALVWFEKSIEDLRQRQQVLRTVFPVHEGKPSRVILPNTPWQCAVLDLSHLTPDLKPAMVNQIATAESRLPFDLNKGPVFRVKILRLDPEEHVLLMTQHHIVSDAWSTLIIIREWAAFYQAQVGNHAPQLPELQIQYHDFAVWQHNHLKGEVFDRQLEFWRGELGDSNTFLELPGDRPRPPAPTLAGGRITFDLKEELTQKLKAINRRTGTTLFMLLETAFAAMLSRLSHQTDINIGTPIAHRQQQRTEVLVGFFVNTMVLRNRLRGNPTFSEALKRFRQTVLNAYHHQDVPFDKIVETLQVQRNMGINALFQAVFLFQNLPEQTSRVSGLRIEPLQDASSGIHCDLMFSLAERETHLRANVEYSSEIFDQSTIIRMLETYQTILTAIADNTDLRIAQLPLLNAAEREKILNTWNAVESYCPPNQMTHHFIEAMARRNPDHLIAISADNFITYGELDRRANRLAHYLILHGAGPEVKVGISMERSNEMLIGLIASLKSGAAYVPLDPKYPEERIAYIRQDARISLIISARPITKGAGDTQQILLEDHAASIARQPCEGPRSEARFDNLAYLIYTSGSTGLPKGVQLSHVSMVHLAWNAAWLLGHSPESRLLQYASINFDASVFEIFSTLVRGGVVCLEKADKILPGFGLETYLLERWITHAAFPPTVVAHMGEDIYDHLEVLVAGGEACPPEVAAKFSKGRRFFNGYGPTEVTVGASAAYCHEGEHPPSIGKVLPQAKLFVTDRAMQPVPIGIHGQLLIGGWGISRGYLHLPALTAERFVPHPFTDIPGSRLYCSGDLVAYYPDGQLKFLGRIDSQVKIRGFRIELGEIMAVLSQHEEVREAIVIARSNANGDKSLAAYVVPETGEVSTDNLRDYVRERLPAFMVPSAFVIMDQLPKTANEKIDQQALPDPKLAELPEGQVFIAPRNSIERRLASLWVGLLGVETVGIHDNFFQLGGHSLMAIQLKTQIRESFRIDIPLKQILSIPELIGMAAFIERSVKISQVPAVGAILPVSRQGQLPLSFFQQRLWFLNQLEQTNFNYNVPLAFGFLGHLNLKALENSFTQLVARHEVLRTLFHSQEGSAHLVIRAPEKNPLSFIDLSHVGENKRLATAQRAAEQDAWHKFDTHAGPLFRTNLLYLGARSYTLLINQHHTISDAWSMGVMIRELSMLYNNNCILVTPRPASEILLELRVQYADYAHWQRRWFDEKSMQKQLSFWSEQLSGAPELIELPTDFERPPVPSFRGSSVTFDIGEKLTTKLSHLAKQCSTTPFTVMEAALAFLLSRYSGQDEVMIGCPSANRDHGELESMLGPFINSLVLRNRLSGDPTFKTLLKRTRQLILNAFANQDLPFEQIIEALQPERDQSYSPLFQVVFNYQNISIEEPDLTGLKALPFNRDHQTARNDLTLTIVEGYSALGGSLEYSSDLFKRETIERMVQQFRKLLEAVVRRPEQKLSHHALLTERERELILNTWNQTETEEAPGCFYGRLFEHRVSETPDVMAFTVANPGIDHHFSYAFINARANQFAHYLQNMGMTSESVVGICLPESVDLITASLGTMKARCCLLLLDPSRSIESLDAALQNFTVSQMITHSRTIDLLPSFELSYISTLVLDEEGDQISCQATQNPMGEPFPQQVAQLSFRLMARDRVQGTQITHGSWMAGMRAQMALCEMGPGNRLHQTLANYRVDALLRSFSALAAGTTLCMTLDSMQKSSRRYQRFLRSRQITLASMPLSVLKRLGRVDLPHLRTLCLSSGIGSREMLESWVREHRMVRSFGPPEMSMSATFSDQLADGTGGGRPVANARAYILDSAMMPVPIGVTGRLYLGGLQLARGYQNSPMETAALFLPNPHRREPGGRIFKTEDLAYHSPEGKIHISKHREIEHLLLDHKAVQDAILLPWGKSPQKRFLAYVVASPLASQGESREADPVKQLEIDLCDYLEQQLPPQWVPIKLFIVKEFPRLDGGGIDLEALPAFDDTTEVMADQKPLTPEQEVLLEIWRDTLDIEQISINENFFDLGGHSLSATRILARINKVFQVELPLQELFDAPSVQAFAEKLAGHRKNRFQPPPMLPVSRDNPMPLSFSQEQLWMAQQFEPEGSAYNLPIPLKVKGHFDLSLLEKALGILINRHEVFRSHFEALEGTPHLIISDSVDLPLGYTDFSALVEAETLAVRIAQEEFSRPFSLNRAPLMRAKAFKTGQREYILVFTIHHVISDGLSANVLIREFTTVFAGLCAEKPFALPKLPIQYADYAHWQRHWMKGAVLEAHLDYWKRHLSGELPILNLPFDRSRDTRQSSRGDRATFTLTPELSRVLRELSRQHSMTINICLLTGFFALLHRYDNPDDIIVGMVTAGRNRVETENLIGSLIDNLVLRADLSGKLSFAELLDRVRQVTLEAYQYQELPFEKLVSVLKPQRRKNVTPIFQVTFGTMAAAQQASTPLPGIGFEPLLMEHENSRYDLTVWMSELPDRLAGAFTFSTELFERSTIETMIGRYQKLLEAMAQNPDERIYAVELLSEKEKQAERQRQKAQEASIFGKLGKSRKRSRTKR